MYTPGNRDHGDDGAPARTRSESLRRAAVVIGATLLGAAIALEAFVRLKHEALFGFMAHETAFRNADFTLYSALIPNARGESVTAEWRVPYAINSWGLRDREFAAGKPPGTLRILAVGDSHVEGFGVRIEDTFVKRLERGLNAMAAAGSRARRYEVINGGVAGYSPLLEYMLLTRRTLQLNPDVVLLFYHFTDLADDAQYESRTLFDAEGLPTRCLPIKRVRPHGRSPVERALSRHSRAFLYLEHKLNAFCFKRWYAPLLGPERSEDVFVAYCGSPQTIDALWQRNERYLDLIGRALAAHGIPWAIVSYPSAVEIDAEEWAEGRRASQVAVGTVFPQPTVVGKLAAFAQARGLPFIDLAPDFKAAARHPLFYPRDGHLNAQGHEVFADALLRHLVEDDAHTAAWLGVPPVERQ